MDNSSNDYHISFFKPTTPQAKANRDMVLWLVIVWFLAIFGFHIVLRIIEKPTPEPIYTEFESSWINVKDGSASDADYAVLGRASLSVLGKIFVTTEEKVALNNTLSHSVYYLTEDSLHSVLIAKIQGFEELENEIEDISDPKYLKSKKAFSEALGPIIGLSELDIRTDLLPLELTSTDIDQLTEATLTSLPAIMSKYLIHNQSVLTDTKFLGFPFHYFYTAVFLLILFVGLCWIYCIRTDKLNAMFNVVD